MPLLKLSSVSREGSFCGGATTISDRIFCLLLDAIAVQNNFPFLTVDIIPQLYVSYDSLAIQPISDMCGRF